MDGERERGRGGLRKSSHLTSGGTGDDGELSFERAGHDCWLWLAGFLLSR